MLILITVSNPKLVYITVGPSPPIIPIDEDEFLYNKGLGSKYEPIRRTMKVGDLRG